LIRKNSVPFTGEFLPNFDFEKYDFALYKGLIMEKKIQICQILNIIFFKSQDFYDKFQQVANDIEGFSLFLTLISSMQPNLATLFCE
jgi:hypothetical protein